MSSRREALAWLVVALVAALGLDLVWGLLSSTTGTLAYGLVDEPAHLATCLVALLAATAVRGAPLPRTFFLAALIGAVAIDVDHLPLYLGSHLVSGDLPRPYSHSLLTIVVLAAIGAASPRRDLRMVCFGAAFGIGSHFFRDMATGPGVPLFWPLSSEVVAVSYAAFAVGVLLMGAVACVPGRRLAVAVSLVLATAAALVYLQASPAAAAAPRKVSIGAYVPRAFEHASRIDSWTAQVGRPPVLVSGYAQWPDPVFKRRELAPIWRRGAMPMVTWEPWNLAGHGFSLRAIAAGRYDRYIRRSARAAVDWGRPLFIRFAHEMNGNWYPWARRRGNSPALYRRAWRHVVSLFRREGATRVRWVWSPFASNASRYGFAPYFPGDRWVDWVGLDGFNWAREGIWQSFTDIFGHSYRVVRHLSARPVMIAETGSGKARKAEWVSRTMDRELPRFQRVRALVWFDQAFNGIDARVDRPPAALQALRRALRKGRYRSSRATLLSTPSRFR